MKITSTEKITNKLNNSDNELKLTQKSGKYKTHTQCKFSVNHYYPKHLDDQLLLQLQD